ncbi:preprotein translocase subunit SecG [Methylocystis sp. JR02]|uniref:preprotein translocase subunit SecG n=1 Tax=Methylocystis sp. JR02 TaxID=3046284 RepID=UPI0024BB2269|nr:preprotein translocase subunit SecG [Methylocystis sp. JR02]MDJ0450260.1 preprotein translocase subunit SecG [Methylocystis sp. JR02]
MQQVIIAIHLMVVTALVILVLYQKSEGGALGMGGSGVFTGRGQANALTRATGILATIFFLTSIALTVLPAWERRAAGGDDWTKAIDQGDIKLKEVKPGEKAPEAGKDSVFEQLQRAQQKRQQSTPVAPAEEKPALRPSQEPPKAEPVTEAPKTEAPKAEAPKSEAPAAEAPKAPEATKSEAPAAPAEAPKAEAPKPETAAPEAPKAETPADKPAAPTQWKSPTQ